VSFAVLGGSTVTDTGPTVVSVVGSCGSGPRVRQADGSIAVGPRMDVGHVARAVLCMANLPLDANVQFTTILATKMPFVGRG
jgi:hypothetical protein